ncbi:MAG TPA: nucleotidyltransferase domain-containing protein [Armatimonadota bacterium]|nr:nucleotidyltransferase domain-containing protein [Armatimonadota bacterium]
MVERRQIDEAIKILADTARPLRIILFGSYARGEETEDSDVDLLVVEREVADRRQEMTRLRRALAPLAMPVDMLVVSEAYFQKWSEAPSTTLYWAKREGQVMYDAA